MHISVLDEGMVDVFLRIFSSAFLLHVPLGFVLIQECSKWYHFGRMSTVCMNVVWFTRQMHSNSSSFKFVSCCNMNPQREHFWFLDSIVCCPLKHKYKAKALAADLSQIWMPQWRHIALKQDHISKLYVYIWRKYYCWCRVCILITSCYLCSKHAC
jgi:hypothetical protein